MSRIYKPVSSRSAVYVTERNLGVQTHTGGMMKIRPGGQFAPGAPKIQTVQSVQHQVEQLRLKEQEVQRKHDAEAFHNQNACRHQKSQTQTSLKPSPEPKVLTNPDPNPTATTPAPPRFTIRSASGGTGKRGTTFTITPRRLSPSRTPSSPVATPEVPPCSSTTPDAPGDKPELSKKRYPTAEEIEVIGGYQKLKRSCLMKKKGGSPRTVRVIFDESPVRVCTYPPETSVDSEEGSSDDWTRTEEKPEEVDEEVCADEVTGAGRRLSRVLRVDESCHR